MIVVMMLDIPKVWRGHADPMAINSGVCYGGSVILIWRMEELFKVLIHEHVHAFGLDRLPSIMMPSVVDLAPGSASSPTESVTEAITALLSSILEGILTGRPADDVFRDQVVWCTHRAAFVWRELPRGPDGVVQSTDAVAYYVVKTLWLWEMCHDTSLKGVFLGGTVLGTAGGGAAGVRRGKPPRWLRWRVTDDSLRMSPPGLLRSLGEDPRICG